MHFDENLMAVDAEEISIITEASLRELEKLWGKEVVAERFRANFVLSVEGDAPFIENDWVGKALTIGEVECKIIYPIQRCRMINIEPKDASLLTLVAKENAANFGVYASMKSFN